MNLYALRFRHCAPRDTKIGVETYVLANTDSEVFDIIKKKYFDAPEDNVSKLAYFFKKEEDEIEANLDYFWKEYIVRHKGTKHHEVSEAFYGATDYFWELVYQNVSDFFANALVNSKVAIAKQA